MSSDIDRIIDGMSPIELVMLFGDSDAIPRHLEAKRQEGVRLLDSEWCDGVTMPPRLPPPVKWQAAAAVVGDAPSGMTKTGLARWKRNQKRAFHNTAAA